MTERTTERKKKYSIRYLLTGWTNTRELDNKFHVNNKCSVYTYKLCLQRKINFLYRWLATELNDCVVLVFGVRTPTKRKFIFKKKEIEKYIQFIDIVKYLLPSWYSIVNQNFIA